MPAELQAEVEKRRAELVEHVAEVDDQLGELFVLEEPVDGEMLADAIRRCAGGGGEARRRALQELRRADARRWRAYWGRGCVAAARMRSRRRALSPPGARPRGVAVLCAPPPPPPPPPRTHAVAACPVPPPSPCHPTARLRLLLPPAASAPHHLPPPPPPPPLCPGLF